MRPTSQQRYKARGHTTLGMCLKAGMPERESSNQVSQPKGSGCQIRLTQIRDVPQNQAVLVILKIEINRRPRQNREVRLTTQGLPSHLRHTSSGPEY